MTGRDLNKLRKEPELTDDIEYESAHDNLATIRKKHDNSSKHRSEKEKSLTLLAEERDKYKTVEDEYLQNKANGEKEVNNKETELKKIKYTLEETETEKKILLNMMARIKSDKIVYDLRKFNMEK